MKRYQEVLAGEGIKLRPASSAGAVQSLALLRDPKSNVNVALVPEGLTTQEESPELLSLGTMYYQPLWIFTRGHLLGSNNRPRALRISIGPEGSSSHAFALMLLSRAGIIDKETTTLLALTPSESAEKLIGGEIDAAVFLEGWESPVVQQLLMTKGVRLLKHAESGCICRPISVPQQVGTACRCSGHVRAMPAEAGGADRTEIQSGGAQRP